MQLFLWQRISPLKLAMNFLKGMLAAMAKHTNDNQRVIVQDVDEAQEAWTAGATAARGTMLAGKATLVAGTVDVAIPGLTSSSSVQITLRELNGTIGADYSAFSTTDKITITSHKADKTVETLDTSVIQYLVIV
jgi:hypothetical protein